MMLRLVIALAWLGSTTAASHAQGELAVPADTRCWHASQSYTEGSLVRVGGKFYACGADNRWTEAASGGANCVYEDRNYSSGALVAVGGTLIACESSGAWSAAVPG